jgi:hypothetical protein
MFGGCELHVVIKNSNTWVLISVSSADTDAPASPFNVAAMNSFSNMMMALLSDGVFRIDNQVGPPAQNCLSSSAGGTAPTYVGHGMLLSYLLFVA